jgi:hypothetical protein
MSDPTFFDAFANFQTLVADLLLKKAVEKGYSGGGKAGGRKLIDFVAEEIADGDGHALGEIVYKARRYKNKRNPEDLVKVAAWAFLAWDRNERRATLAAEEAEEEDAAQRP